MKRFLTGLILLVLSWGQLSILVAAAEMTQAQKDVMRTGLNYFNTDRDVACSNLGVFGGSTTGPSSAPPSQLQTENAKIVIGIAKTANLGKEGALIGLMVAIAESRLLILANTNVPVSEGNPAKQGDGSDHDSVGIFQQRPSTAWSTFAPQGGDAALSNKDAVWQLMDPKYAAEAFFGSPPGSDAPGPLKKGLQNIDGWQSLPLWVAAQKVQVSGTPDGSNYRVKLPQAQAFVDQLYDTAPAIPLPVPQTGGTKPTVSAPSSVCNGGGASTHAGYINPFKDPGWALARTDQGVDYQPQSELPVLAIGDGTIIRTDGAGWPGGVFIYYKLSDGDMAGKCIFVAEHLKDVLPAGSKIKAGQTIAIAIPGYPWTEWGWAQGTQTPSTPYNGQPDGTQTEGGKAFARFLRSLGAQTQDDPGPGPQYAGATCP